MPPDVAEERVALVTGAARGLGAATVRALAAEGLRVVALDSCAGEDHHLAGVGYPLGTAADLGHITHGQDGRVATAVADVRDRAALDKVAAETLDRWGRLDVVVAAAAVLSGGRPQWETPYDELAAMWEVDVGGVWHTAAATVPHLLASPDPSSARFVAVASTAGEHGMFHLTAYACVKHAVVGLVRGLAADLVGTGVCAVAVSPGPMTTHMLAATARLYGVSEDELVSRQLLRTPLSPDEVACTIAFCCSRGARALNGSVVTADGGHEN